MPEFRTSCAHVGILDRHASRLHRGQRHLRCGRPLALESDAPVVERDQAAVGNDDAMGVDGPLWSVGDCRDGGADSSPSALCAMVAGQKSGHPGNVGS